MSDPDDRSAWADAPRGKWRRPQPQTAPARDLHDPVALPFLRDARPDGPAAPGWHYRVGTRAGFIPEPVRHVAGTCPVCGDRAGCVRPLCDGCATMLLGPGSIRTPARAGVRTDPRASPKWAPRRRSRGR